MTFKRSADTSQRGRYKTSGPGQTELSMLARFCGGPYDGLEFEEHDVNRCARPLPSGTGENFIRMPPRPDWEAVLRGDKNKDGPFAEPCPVYERVLLADEVEFRFETGGGFPGSAPGDSRDAGH